MTEPEYAGSNPTRLGTTAVREGDDYVINGHKWFTSSADGAAFAVVMAVTNPDAAPHERASMIIVPTNTPGFNLVRNIPIFGETGEGWASHAQIDLNQRKMRSLFLLTAHQIEYEKGTIDDPVKAQEEANRPDGMIELNEGALTGNKFRRVDHITEAEAHVELGKEDVEFIHAISGITDENVGNATNAISGKAITARQLQGHTTSGVFFDNFYLSFQLRGEIENALIEQFMDQEKEVLVSGGKSKDEFLTINKNNGNGEIENCITRSKARFIVGKQDFRESLRIAMFETLSELVSNLSQTLPNVALALLDMVVEYMDELPNKDELVTRIRKINGQRSPEDEEMTDEEKAQAEQSQQAKTEQENLLTQLKLASMKVQNDRLAGEALKYRVDAQMKKLEGFIKALEAAGIVKNNPALTEAADSLIEEAEKISDETPQGKQGGADQQQGMPQQNAPAARQLNQQPIQQPTGGGLNG